MDECHRVIIGWRTICLSAPTQGRTARTAQKTQIPFVRRVGCAPHASPSHGGITVRSPRSIALLAVTVAVVLAAAAPADAKGPDDQIIVSGSLNVPAGQTVGDVVMIDGPVTVAGRVDGDLVTVNSRVTVSGVVDGDVVTVSKRLVLEPKARVNGDVYYGSDKPTIAPGATVTGKVKRGFRKIAGPSFGAGAYLLIWLAVSLSTLALGALLVWLAPRALDAAFDVARSSVGAAIGWGVLLFFGLPVAAIIALVTLIGIPFGGGLLLAWAPIAAVGYATGAFLVGRLVLRTHKSRFLALLAGLGIVRVVALVPFLGGVTWFVLTVIGLGTLLVALWRARRGPSDAPAAG
jgi:cytoskeletal protein CcmA (bactofilin family)